MYQKHSQQMMDRMKIMTDEQKKKYKEMQAQRGRKDRRPPEDR